jgi:hypothetical protein
MNVNAYLIQTWKIIKGFEKRVHGMETLLASLCARCTYLYSLSNGGEVEEGEEAEEEEKTPVQLIYRIIMFNKHQVNQSITFSTIVHVISKKCIAVVSSVIIIT